MNYETAEKAADLIRQGKESEYIDLIANYCIESETTPESANNAVAFGKFVDVPYYMDSKVENRIKEIKRG